MLNLFLVTPDHTHAEAAIDYVKEHRAFGEMRLIGTGGLYRAETYGEWLSQVASIPVFFACRGIDSRIVGMINIRRQLSEVMRHEGGHIGYGVRPSERRQGYATCMLALGLAECQRLGIHPVLVTCDQENTASRKTIERNGGCFENIVTAQDGRVVRRYWFVSGSSIGIPN